LPVVERPGHRGDPARASQVRLRPTLARVLLLLFTTGVALLLGGVGFIARWTAAPSEDGVRWATSPEGVVVAEIDPGGPGERAGLAPGDRLLAIDGEPISSPLDAESRGWLASPGRPLPLTLLRGGRQLLVDVIPEGATEDLHLYTYLALVGLLSLVLATTLALRLPPSQVRFPYYLLGLVAFCLLVFSPSGRGGAIDWALYWGDEVARAFFASVFLHFALAFSLPRRTWRGALAILAGYLPGIGILALDAWLVGAAGVYRYALPPRALEARDRLELGLLAVGLTAGVLTLAIAYFRSKRDRVRRPLKWLFTGAAIGLGPFVALYLAPAAVGIRLPGWSELSALPLLFLPLCSSAAVARYRLTDLELFFKRGLTTGALLGSTVALYLASMIVFRRLFDRASPGLPEVMAVFLVALLLPRLNGVIGNAVDRIVYRDRFDHRRTLQEFGRDLSRERELRPLLAKLGERLVRTLGIDRAWILVHDPAQGVCGLAGGIGGPPPDLALAVDSPLAKGLARSGSLDLDDLRDPRGEASPAGAFEAAGFRYLVPLTVQGVLVGVLMLPERRDGAPLNSEDRQLLEDVAQQAAIAVEGARLFGELRRRAQEIERLKDFNEGILDCSRVGILVVEAGERIVAWNRALAEITGRPAEAAVGRTLDEAFDPGFAVQLRQALATPEGAEPRRFRQTLLGPGGKTRFVHLGFSVPPAGEGPLTWVVTLDDVTEEVHREEILIQQERLASIGLLASGVAHEVNTPLTGISSYAQMLLEETDPSDPRYGLLKRIEQQSFRASDIANRLLNFSRPDRHGFVGVDLNDLVEETLSLFEPQLRGCKIFVRREVDDDLPAVLGHRGKLQQVLLNLLLNARDAMAQGGEIWVRTAAEPGGVRVEVQDTGEGIRPEILGRIYDPFFTTKGPGKGTGLGLSIAYGIVQEHSGRLTVDSRPGEGSRFTIHLPREHRSRLAAN